MKYIIRLFVGMVVFLAATSCHTSEIDNPDNTKPNGQPSDSELSITASIIQTRVTYTDDTETLNQQWEDGDVLFGYIGGEAKEENRVSFTVRFVDPTTHIATLDAGSYKSTLLSSVNKVVDLVYTGQEQLYQADGSVNVIMSSQSANGKIPACMHSRATVTKENNVISLEFRFYNDCAIFEIVSLTGVNEENLSGSLQLTSIEATNLYQEGKYTLGENGFEFAGVEESMGNVSLTLGGDWHVNTDGTITDGTTSRALIAVVPIAEDDKKDIKFTSTTDTSQDFSFDYGAHKLDAGVCYVIGAKPVVARTSDGQYFTTVKDAFDHAATLNIPNNTVTLVDDAVGLGEHPQPKPCEDWDYDKDGNEFEYTYLDASLAVEVNKEITLDLNGHILSLVNSAFDDSSYRNGNYDPPYDSRYNNSSEYFQVNSSATLNITDSKMSGGTIESEAKSHIILNKGKVNIDSGILKHNADWCAVRNDTGATLTVKHGTLHSEEYCPIGNEGDVTIYGGTISSTDGNAINNWYPGTVNIYGGNISSDEANAIYSDGTINIGSAKKIVEPHDENIYISSTGNNNNGLSSAINILNGTLNMYEGEVTGDDGAMMLCGSEESETSEGSNVWEIDSSYNPIINIYGGYIHVDEDGAVPIYVIGGAQCVISGGVISNNATSGVNPALITYSGTPHVNSDDGTSLTIKWAANDDEDNNNGQPVIYSASSSVNSGQESISYQNVPLCYTSGNQRTNYSVIEISGGYICSSTDCFFEQDVEDNYDLWENGTIGGFYANTPSIYYDHSDSTNLSASSYGGVSASKATGKSITIPYINKQISTLYLVKKVSE